VGEVGVLTADGRQLVVVTGSNGENAIRGQAETVDEAWWRAVEQARSLGMLR
jgi:hypothetical protein